MKTPLSGPDMFNKISEEKALNMGLPVNAHAASANLSINNTDSPKRTSSSTETAETNITQS